MSITWKKLGLLIFVALAVSRTEARDLVVMAGPAPHELCPVTLTLGPDQFWFPLADGDWKLVCEGEEIPLQVIRRDVPTYGFQLSPEGSFVVPFSHEVWELNFIVIGMKPLEKRVYQIVNGKAASPNAVALSRDPEKIDIQIGGKPLTIFKYAVNEKQPRPIFYPLFGPNGARMTRGYPMESFPGEHTDHPHQQSFWVSHGDVNGVDFWALGAKQGYQRVNEIALQDQGPVLGLIETMIDWESVTGDKIMHERRAVTFWGTSDAARMIDFDLTFVAAYGDVTFGDTKEGGLVSLRIASTLCESQDAGKTGGTITNSNGQVHMDQTWGKPAPWCDYSGPVGGITAGLSIMDHPENLFYPTPYHVRDYGLFTANPFGLSYFMGKEHNGSRTLPYGQAWHLRYRVYIHDGDVKSGNVAEAYVDYIDPPRVILE